MPAATFKISDPLNPVTEIKQALREARRADQLVEQSAIRTFQVFRALKFNEPAGPPSAIDRTSRAHDQLSEARVALRDTIHQIEKILQQGGYTLPARD